MKMGFIGAGSIGKRHLMNFVRQGGDQVVIYDPREDRRNEAAAVAQKWGEKGKIKVGVELVADAGTLFDAKKTLDALLIASPPDSHISHLERAAEIGVPAMCEKPLCKDDDDFDRLSRIIDIMDQKKVICQVAYNYRFWPHLMQLKSIVDSGEYGKVLTVRGTFSENLREWHPWEGLNFYMSSKQLGGGALLDESHLIDLVRWIFGDFGSVCGVNRTISSLKEEKVFETDDLVEMLVHFTSGAVGSLHMDLFGKHHEKKLEIVTEDAKIEWHYDNSDVQSNRIEIYRGKRIYHSPEMSLRLQHARFSSDGHVRNFMYLEQMGYFMEAVKNKRHSRADVTTLVDGLKTMRVLKSVRISESERRFVDVVR